MKFHERKNDAGEVIGVAYYCPGCKCGHSVPVPRWTYNGNPERPTIHPSVRHFTPAGEYGGKHHPEKTHCHYFVKDGQIAYCGDSDHELKNKTIDLVDFPEGYGVT